MKIAFSCCLLIFISCSRPLQVTESLPTNSPPVPPSRRMEPDGGSIGTSGGGDLRAFLSNTLQEPARELYRANEFAAPGHFSDRGWKLFRVARAEISKTLDKYIEGFPIEEFPPISNALYDRAREDSLFAAELILVSVEEAMFRKFPESNSAARAEICRALISIIETAAAQGLVVPGV